MFLDRTFYQRKGPVGKTLISDDEHNIIPAAFLNDLKSFDPAAFRFYAKQNIIEPMTVEWEIIDAKGSINTYNSDDNIFPNWNLSYSKLNFGNLEITAQLINSQDTILAIDNLMVKKYLAE